MKVLFLSRAKGINQASPVIYAQAKSLSGSLELSSFLIEGSGWGAYPGNILKLRRHLKLHHYDLIHAHYSWIGIIASLSTKTPVVVSLMGSDIEDYTIGRILIKIFNNFSWKAVIIKSQRSLGRIKLKKAHIIPNGVNLNRFKPISMPEAKRKLGVELDKKVILFLSDPARKEKNFQLAAASCNILGSDYSLLTVHNVPHDRVPLYLSAADVLILTSLFEGSPNVIKEAMACNCPIVSTDVGDVREVIGDTKGCYITSFEPEDVATKLKLALEFGKRTNGREKILHLDEKIIAKRLVEVYEAVLKK